MEKWFVMAKKADFDAWSRRFCISPVTARIIRNRDMLTEEDVERYLHGSILDLYPPELMLDMEDAAAIMEEQIRLGNKIRVIGDYDVDGVTAAHILTKGLRALSACVDTVIPHRVRDGYGLNEQLIEDAYRDGIKTIITCDNGIAAASQIALAVEKKMTVVVTDHHEVPFEEQDGVRTELLPPAAAVVDPKRRDCRYPYKNICGAVVAYKLISLMLRHADREPAWVQALLDEFLQLAAVATVCDVMDLLDENRILVKEGLKKMRTSPCPGLQALMEVNGLEPAAVSAYHLGFIIGPCLNATGRLDTAKRALSLLAAEDRRLAVSLAGELKEMNDSRKSLTQNGLREACSYVEERHMEKDKVLVVFLPDCHESLAGIIAGRLREKYARPAFVLTSAEEGIKGSGRSIESYSMFEALTAQKELLAKFGGHKMAAGLTLLGTDEAAVDAFRRRLNEACTLTEEDFAEKIHIDMVMPISYATMELAEELALLEPFGTANEKPLFACREVHFLWGKRLGSSGRAAKFSVSYENRKYELMYFGDIGQLEQFLCRRFDARTANALFSGGTDVVLSITYQIGLHTYMGRTGLQLIMQNYC